MLLHRFLVVTTLIAALTSMEGPSGALGGAGPLKGGREIVPGKVVYMSRPGSTSARLLGASTVARTPLAAELAAMGMTVVDVAPRTEMSAATHLAAQRDVQIAQPVYRYKLILTAKTSTATTTNKKISTPRTIVTPNDPLFGLQYHHQIINSPTAWGVSTGSGAITIAILDTGVDPFHPDLASKLVGGFNFYDNNTNTADVEGHGTSVAGTAAAIGNNGIGVAGVAWINPIMPVRIASPQGDADSTTIAAAMHYAVDHGAKVVNCSFGPIQGDQIIYAATRYVVGQGGLVFIAAGNDGVLDPTPAESSINFVSATDQTDTITSWSTFGPAVTLAAPGVNIETTSMGGGYSAPSGTSFSSPMAAGVAALVWSVNPAMTNVQVQTILYTTAKDLGAPGRDNQYGFGRIDAGAALLAASGQPVPPPDTTPPTAAITSPSGGATLTGVATVNVTASDNVGVVSVNLQADGLSIGLATVAPYTFSWDTTTVANGTHTLVAVARDAAGNSGGSAGVTVNVTNSIADLKICFPQPGYVWSRRDLLIFWSSRRGVEFRAVDALVDGIIVARSRTRGRWERSLRGGVLELENRRSRITPGTHTLQLRGVETTGTVATTSPQTLIKK